MNDQPNDILLLIFKYVSGENDILGKTFDIFRIQLVCKKWYQLINDKIIAIENFLDRSNFSLIEIHKCYENIEFIGRKNLLFKCAQNGKVRIINQLKDMEFNLNVNHDKALQIASRYGRLNVVSYLVENKANVNNNLGESLKLSIDNDHFDVAKFLIKNGANISVLNSKQSESLFNSDKRFVINPIIRERIDKSIFYFMAFILFTIMQFGPYIGYIEYDKLYPSGIYVYDNNVMHKYKSFDICGCASNTSTYQNTICFYDDKSGKDKCIKPTSNNFYSYYFNLSLMWFPDILVSMSVFTLFVTTLYLFTRENSDFWYKFRFFIACNFCCGYWGLLTIIRITLLIIANNIYDVYVCLLISIIGNYIQYLIGFIIIINDPIVKSIKHIIYALIITIVLIALLHSLGIFVTQLVFWETPQLQYYGWKFPNFYNFCVGEVTAIIIFMIIISACYVCINASHK
jgi:ankyrin repeat protein